MPSATRGTVPHYLNKAGTTGLMKATTASHNVNFKRPPHSKKTTPKYIQSSRTARCRLKNKTKEQQSTRKEVSA